ncbi:hypothetical protein [Streptomyces sp. NPDC090445]|uniref:hypothetical protein n=1 Tax=Streptomyces sp. NPDC090445 TaxID=3365963 RepID=UPI00381A948F
MKQSHRLAVLLSAATAMVAVGSGAANAQDGPLLPILSPLLCGNINQGFNNQGDQTANCNQTSTTTPPPANGGFTGHEVVSTTFGVPVPGNSLTFELECPAGKTALSGGHRINNFGMGTAETSAPTAGNTGWEWRIRNNDSEEITGTAYVTCAVVTT